MNFCHHEVALLEGKSCHTRLELQLILNPVLLSSYTEIRGTSVVEETMV